MKKYILLSGLIAFAILPVSAELTVDDVSSPNYLINHGHSSIGAEAVARSKAATAGVPYESFKEEPAWNSNPIVKVLNRFYTYLDPAADQDTFLNHDIKITPSIDDL